jgi:predicted nuclease of predicted toxin-antitoxin system
MRFVVDANLPLALALWLIEKGQEAKHVYQFGFEGTQDHLIWQKAKDLKSTIISKDFDFVLLHQRDQSVPVIYYNRGNVKKKQLLDHFELIFPQVISALENGERLIEIT